MSIIRKLASQKWRNPRLAFWKLRKKTRTLRAFLSKHVGLIIRSGLVLVAFCVGLIIDGHRGNSPSPALLSSFLISVAVMAGGTIAVVFAISTFLLQGIADIYSSKYFEIYVHDWRERAVYFLVILITICFLGAGIYVGSLTSVPEPLLSLIVLASMSLIGVVFSVIDWHYRNVRQKLSPLAAIAFLREKGIKSVHRLRHDAAKIAQILREEVPSRSEEECTALAYKYPLQPFINDLERQLESLLMLSLKSAGKQEVQTVYQALTAFHDVVVKYLEARSASSFAIPSRTVLMAIESDSQAFLSRCLDRFNEVGERFAREGRTETTTKMIWLYYSLGSSAANITFRDRPYENPIFDLVVGYTRGFIDYGKRIENVEIVFQGSRVMSDLATLAAAKGLATSLHTIQKEFPELAVFGLLKKQVIIVNQCLDGCLNTIDALFSNEDVRKDTEGEQTLSNIAEISNLTLKCIKSGRLTYNYSWGLALLKGYGDLSRKIAKIIAGYSRVKGDENRASYRSDIIWLFEEIGRSIRKLSEETHDCDSLLAVSVGNLLFDANRTLVYLTAEEEFADNYEDLVKNLHRNIHLPYWFMNNATTFDGGSNSFHNMTEGVAKTGFLVMERLNDKELCTDCINSLASIAEECLKKTKNNSGYDEPRALKKACYLGVLASKKGWDDVVDHLRDKIFRFESDYTDKYKSMIPQNVDTTDRYMAGPLNASRLFRELQQWRDRLNDKRRHSSSEVEHSIEDVISQLVKAEDVDEFLRSVWGPALSVTGD